MILVAVKPRLANSVRLVPTFEEAPSAHIPSKPNWQGVSYEGEKHLQGHAFTEKPDNYGYVCYHIC